MFREVPVQGGAQEDSEQLHPGGAPVLEPRTPSQILGVRQDVQRVEAALEQLPEIYAEVIRLGRLQRLPYKEIGVRLGGRSEDAVRKLLHRALIKLTGLVSDRSGEGHEDLRPS